MLEKGIVLELKADYAIVMKQGGCVIRIKRKPDMSEGDQIYILPEDLYEKPSKITVLRTGIRNQTAVRKTARMAIAAAMAVLVILALIPSLSTTAYAVVSIDAQQHIQFQVNEDQSVLEASSPDGSLPELQLQQLKGRNLLELGPELAQMLGSGPFLVAYAPYDGDADPQTEQQIRQMFQHAELLYLIGNAQDISEAKDNAQSLGLYMLELLMSKDHADDLDDFYEDYFGLDDEDDDEINEIDEDDSETDDDNSEDLEDYEQLPLQKMMDLAQAHPEFMNDEQFREALEEKQAKQDQEMSDDNDESDTAETEDSNDDENVEENDDEDESDHDSPEEDSE